MDEVMLDPQDTILVRGAKVLGYDKIHESPIIDFGTGPTTLDRARRQGWDNDEERFSDADVKKIYDHLRTHLAR